MTYRIKIVPNAAPESEGRWIDLPRLENYPAHKKGENIFDFFVPYAPEGFHIVAVEGSTTTRELPVRDAEIAELKMCLEAAVRAAKLALFVINKAGVMPNGSWKNGFDKDMAIAERGLNYKDSEK